MDKSTINKWPCSKAMLNYQRVEHVGVSENAVKHTNNQF
jgi:hypothetical protein